MALMSDTPMPARRPVTPASLSMTPLGEFAESPQMPWWFRAAYVFGVPTIAAGFLIWVLTMRVDNNLTDIKTGQALQQQQISAFIAQQGRMESLLQQICANSAPTYQDRSACFTRGK